MTLHIEALSAARFDIFEAERDAGVTGDFSFVLRCMRAKSQSLVSARETRSPIDCTPCSAKANAPKSVLLPAPLCPRTKTRLRLPLGAPRSNSSGAEKSKRCAPPNTPKFSISSDKNFIDPRSPHV
ncbi:MAG TPA: hypothetical protein VF627_09205 [Abditibacterium sp.]